MCVFLLFDYHLFEVPVQIFSLISTKAAFFFLSYRTSLCSLNMSQLSGVCTENIFSHSEGCHFILLMVTC